MTDKSIRETREEKIGRLCGDLLTWGERVCNGDKTLLLAVIGRFTSGFLATFPEYQNDYLETLPKSITLDTLALQILDMETKKESVQ